MSLQGGASSQSAVRTDAGSDASYVMGDGTVVRLLTVMDEAAVRFKAGRRSDKTVDVFSGRADLESVTLTEHYESADLDILRREAGKDKSASDVPLAEALLAQPEVEAVYPVYAYAADMSRVVAFGEILLCLEEGTDEEALNALLSGIGAQIVRETPAKDLRVYVVALNDAAVLDTLEASVEMAGWDGVAWAEPNFLVQLRMAFTPNDPLYSKQQTMHNTGQNGGTTDADVDAPEAWDVTRGNAGVVVAIIDDGVDTTHPDLGIEPGGWDFRDGDADPRPVGTDGHGTSCAGVAAAVGNNGAGVTGIAPNSKVLPIRVANTSGFATDEVLGNAIRYAADRADVLSNSWGGGAPSTFINSAIDYATTSGRDGLGCPVFFATGNSATNWSTIRFSLDSLGAGQYRVGFRYIKDSTDSAGLDAAWIDNVRQIASDGYTQVWRQDFEGSTFPPTGWETLSSPTSAAKWARTSGDKITGTGGAYSAKSGTITHSQWTELMTPVITWSIGDTLPVSIAMSSEQGYDGINVRIYNASGTYMGQFNLISGVWTASTPVGYPASYANSIAIGSVTDCDRRSDYSQYGAELDFLAPSNGGWNNVVTLDPVGSAGATASDYNMNFGGTSSATPLAAGISALMLAKNPSLTAAEIRTAMRKSCDKVGGVTYSGGDAGAGGRHDQYGYGRINAKKALDTIPEGPTTGSLTVTISPDKAVAAGARWALDGGEWQDSGTTLEELPAGEHTVSFKMVGGWTTPESQAVTVVGGQSRSVTGTYLDVIPPTGSILINNNRSATNTAEVTLNLAWNDGNGSGVTRMRFSNNGSTWSAWESLKANRAYTLPGPEGHNTIRVQFLDSAGNRSVVYSDFIRLDTTLPTGTILINNNQSTTKTPNVTLNLTWSDGTGAGVTRMRFSNNGSTWSGWEPQKAAKSWTLGGSAPGYYTVRVQYLDGAGNVSERYSDYIRLAP